MAVLEANWSLVEERGITLLGLSVGNLHDEDAVQLTLPFERSASESLDTVVDSVRSRFGGGAIRRAARSRRPGLHRADAGRLTSRSSSPVLGTPGRMLPIERERRTVARAEGRPCVRALWTAGPGRVYDDTRHRIGRFLDEAGPSIDALRGPACPDWTVADLTAHLAGAPVALLDRQYPGDDTERWVWGHVAARRGRSSQENWLERNSVGPAYGALLEKNESAWGSLLYDAIIHEDDLLGAVGAPRRVTTSPSTTRSTG